jgi:transcriptional regulator with XRE-family HTH domain
MTTKEHCLLLEQQGYNRTQIAEKVGVTRQRVYQILGTAEKGFFKPFTEQGCIYPNWRKWMNDHKVSVPELTQKMGMDACSNNYGLIKRWMRGDNFPLKFNIDKLIEVTGLSYEELFSREGG